MKYIIIGIGIILLIIGSPIILVIYLYHLFIEYWYGVSSAIYNMSDNTIKFHLNPENDVYRDKLDPIYSREMLLREWISLLICIFPKEYSRKSIVFCYKIIANKLLYEG